MLMNSIIDSHIHLDLYEAVDRNRILQELRMYHIDSLISVSKHLNSSRKNLRLSKKYKAVKPAFGYHPEQPLPKIEEKERLFSFIKENHHQMIAVGEVGLPYYLRQDNPAIAIEPYVDLFETFIQIAKTFHKPIVLHTIYDDASIACDLLEKHSIKKAHFHWFKGDHFTIKRMIRNGYFISVTPEILYRRKIEEIVNIYPLSQIMVETDGPWSFQGPFKNQITHPKMIHKMIKKIASIKQMDDHYVYAKIYENTSKFYELI